MENAIHEATAALTSALERADAAAASDVYAVDARLLAPSLGPIEGRAEIEAYWRAGIDLGLSGLTFESRLLEPIDGCVLELGRYAIDVRAVPSASVVEHGSFLVLHTQTADGSWRRAVEVFNADEPKPTHPDLGKETR